MRNWLPIWSGTVSATVAFFFFVAVDSQADDLTAARQSLEKTRLELQQQGFKTAVTDFDFSTSPELRASEAILKAASRDGLDGPAPEHPNLMEAINSNTVIVVWQQDHLKRETPAWPSTNYDLTWDDFRDQTGDEEAELAAARVAILSGPIQFDLQAADGNSMLLPHLALLKRLTLTFNDCAMLALHAGDRAAALTNLLAATHLVTAWNPEPVTVSDLTRFANAQLVFGATWQLLQTNAWTDDQLAHLQAEWAAADFLGRLPEIQAFQRASDLQAMELDPATAQKPGPGMFDDEARLLLFYRDREIEYHNAVQATNWAQMRQMPGVTNEVFFQPKSRFRGPFAMSRIHRQTLMQFQGQGIGILGHAAQAEAERRLIMAAIALERYRIKHGEYPDNLAALAPEFVKAVPLDFMSGQPLHYHPSPGGRFFLYSVGLDCADNGDTIVKTPSMEERAANRAGFPRPAPEPDIVWPLAASPAQTIASHEEQSRIDAELKTKREAGFEAEAKQQAQEAEEARKAAMKKLLAEKSSLGPEPVYQGTPLSLWVIKAGQREWFDGPPADAIAAIRAIGPKAVPFLLEWMPHPGMERPVEGFPGWDGLEVAWFALGSEGKAAIPTLAHIIGRSWKNADDYSVWTENDKAISYLGPDAIMPMLTVVTNLHGQHELWEFVHNFGNLGTNGAPAIPALIGWANDPDSWMRDGVVSALGEIGQRPDLAVPVISKALNDSDWMVRRDAGTALGAFAKDSKDVLPVLAKIVKDPPDWQARSGALSGLGRIQDQPEAVIPLIVPYLDDDNSVVARSAAYALRDLGSEAGYKALVQATNNPNIGDIIYEVQEKMRHPPGK
ncbi:MAG TPA: HEAT repeat domain-containing protein [Candidatus Acidoferrales bacterium]|nr:HEAT repeat domain-containing protein [Candidatus Acidoferrales bacterium]